jgi:hypothetical protein
LQLQGDTIIAREKITDYLLKRQPNKDPEIFRQYGEITHVESIATGSSVRERVRLSKKYGQSRWRKLKGVARVRLIDGTL